MTSDAQRAKDFFTGPLGLTYVSDDPFAIVFNANGTTLRVSKAKEVKPAAHTVLGWEVADIETAVRGLAAAGIVFNRYEGFGQDELGIWTAPGGAAKVAWFQDPDGNVLSVSQHAGC